MLLLVLLNELKITCSRYYLRRIECTAYTPEIPLSRKSFAWGEGKVQLNSGFVNQCSASINVYIHFLVFDVNGFISYFVKYIKLHEKCVF